MLKKTLKFVKSEFSTYSRDSDIAEKYCDSERRFIYNSHRLDAISWTSWIQFSAGC